MNPFYKENKIKLKGVLEDLIMNQNIKRDLSTDPIRYPKQMSDPLDREIVGLFSALLAYGRVKFIGEAIERFLECTGSHPSVSIVQDTPTQALKRFEGFIYRFTRGADLSKLWFGLGQIYKKHKSLKEAFLKWDSIEPKAKTLIPVLTRFHREIQEESATLSGGRGFSHLFSNPTGGSAIKRLNLFLRWFVRGPDAVDFGDWRSLGSHRLIMPIDVHVFRTSRALGLTNRKSIDLKTAIEITEMLRTLEPRDPLRYDFSMAHLGISGDCKGYRDVDICPKCSLRELCSFNQQA